VLREASLKSVSLPICDLCDPAVTGKNYKKLVRARSARSNFDRGQTDTNARELAAFYLGVGEEDPKRASEEETNTVS
jgi:hypothetical protein